MNQHQMIIQACREAIKHGNKLELTGEGFPKGFPCGELIETTSEGKKWYAYCPHEVLKYYAKYEILGISVVNDEITYDIM